MFQPQPTPYSSFYPAYLPVGVEDDGLSDGFGGVQAAGYSTYPQAPFASLSLGGPGPQAGAPGPPASGPGPAGGSCHDAHGGAAGVPVDVRSAPLPVFPFHSTLPLHQHHQPGAPSLFDHRQQPSLQRQQQQRQQQQQQQHYSPSHSSASHVKMEQNQGLPDDFAAQEAAARTWEPEVEGPLLGDRTTITAITEQYAKADPVYVDKTMALPQTYSHYRPVKGDGNCGWRAIGFCYFELLIQQGSREIVDGERLRLTQLNDYLVNSGNYDPDLFVDFVDDTFELLKQISDSIHDHDTAMAVLTTKFNDLSSMNILFHLRLLAGAWLRGNRDQYAGWCEADPETYAQTVIEPAQREIEELGVVLLVEVLLKPVGFTLEIAYLDRSQGSQVNTHRFPDGDPNNIGPFIHLLYRPGHYDILYKPTTTNSTTLQVNRMAYAPTYHESAGPQFQDTFSLTNPLALIPGFGTVGPVSSMGQLTGPSLDYPSSPQSPWFSSPYADSSPTPPAQPQPSQQTSLPAQSIPGPSTTHEIRFSRYQYAEPMDTNAWPEQPLQTNTFKNSHFNTAHYNNPNFQPEEYRPGYDDWIERCERPGKKKGHHKAGHSSSDDSTGRGDTKAEK
ncbi:hypothetical protein INS49_001286 [Diaporthe citri]|uniref:uncharacterized protein n=1 Tax=Diaporthe citri TaxID=83186 RepID=UPI001C7E484C|nr:uncharacterized protein INS49_001286 [Diaporthe citri]KAG6367104.1 hypothetical protein INS49_001286 [Diaporthe citri]